MTGDACLPHTSCRLASPVQEFCDEVTGDACLLFFVAATLFRLLVGMSGLNHRRERLFRTNSNLNLKRRELAQKLLPFTNERVGSGRKLGLGWTRPKFHSPYRRLNIPLTLQKHRRTRGAVLYRQWRQYFQTKMTDTIPT